MSSEKNPQPQKLATARGSQDKETSDSLALTSSPSQSSDIHQRTQQFNEMHLADLQKVFEKETDKNGALNKEGFIRVMKKMLSSMTEEMLEVLFLKVDSDCNGFVTWQKYVDYMMREFQGKEEMRKSQYRLRFYLPMTIIPLHHGSEVVKVAFLIQRFKKMGCFLTVTKDGVLQFWSETFSMMNSFRLTQTQQFGHQQMWVVDMVCIHNMNLIAVASTELKIEFFDISNHKCVRAFTFIDLDSCVMVMDYWSDYHKAVFCYGDTKGNVVIFMSDNVTGGLFNPQILPRTSKWDNWTNVSLRKLLNEKSPLYRSYRMKSLHPNWCQQVKFIPQLNVVVSCSAIERSSLVLIILPTKDPEKPRLSSLNLRKGILCFDYCPDRNFLATGGYDPHIRLWNPLVSKRPVWLMKGHQTSVIHLLVNSKNTSILISISRDKNIRVWDLQDYVCLQSFCGKLFPLGNCPITSAYFHKDSTLICSTYNIGILRGYLESQGPMKTGKMSTHSSALCAVLYSKVFKQVKDAEECIASTKVSPKDNGQKWAHKLTTKSTGFTVRRMLMSAPPVMKHQRDMDQERRMSQQKSSSAQNRVVSNILLSKSSLHKTSLHKDAQKRKGDFWKKLQLQPNVSVEKIIFLQTRPRLPHTAALLSSCIDGFIYAWSIHGNGGLLGKFPVDLEENGNIVVGAMTTDENDWILITGDSTGNIKIWDIKDYCLFVGQRPLQPSGIKISTEGENKFRFLIPRQLQVRTLNYIPQKEKEVVDGQTISLVPPPLLVTWRSHLESVADLLYVDIFQLVVSGSEDGDVKAWKLSGDVVGTFGLNLWKRLQEAKMIDDQEQAATLEEKSDLTGITLKKSFLELHKDLAEALVYQRREQAVLMAFLHGKEEKEAEARARLHQMSLISPWTKEHSVEDIEESWNQWAKDKQQASKIVGAAYKPKERVRNPNLLATRVQYGWMRQQISPQVYQSLCFTDLKPVSHPDFLMHKVLDQQGRHIRWVASDIRSELESIRGQIFPDVGASSTPAATPSSVSMLSLGASASRVVDANCSTSLRPRSSVSLLRPWSASPAQSSSSTSPQNLSQPRKGQKPPASCGIRSPGEPPSCPL
ncbi:EF-hand calcium-binding domain-containing protein 8 isoform X4 [Mesocricetus auratus]|uniref:WD repeat-containing protein on Y chromosome n=1 Tax=Mesocricetus auratus TaxID=10036 RepID=A0ABM2XI71_MESAU|nr:EF-hand calcium-binding domain-containing protein 8 isoform X4 [Mesocricetus auratus]